MSAVYPWHAAAWQQISGQWHSLPHAWLFYGREHTGKTAFARHFAQALLCENLPPNRQPCGQCPSCRLFEHGSHPDFYPLAPDTPEEGGSRRLAQIKIDAVRAVLEPLNQSSVRGGRRVVLIAPADSLNVQAANALLKILEEPPQAVVFLLAANQRERLLPTIRSRCRQMPLPLPAHAEALAFLRQRGTDNAENLLAFHGGAPLFEPQPEQDALRETLLDILAAPRLLAVLDFAAALDKAKYPLALLLDWLGKWLADTARAQHGLPPHYYPARAEACARAAAQSNPATLFRFQAALNRLAPYGHHSLNVRMQAEDLLCAYLLMLQKNKSVQ